MKKLNAVIIFSVAVIFLLFVSCRKQPVTEASAELNESAESAESTHRGYTQSQPR